MSIDPSLLNSEWRQLPIHDDEQQLAEEKPLTSSSQSQPLSLSVRKDLYFVSWRVSDLRNNKQLQSKKLFISMLQNACSSKAFIDFSERCGIVGASFQPSTVANDDTEEEFYRCIRNEPDMATLAVVFHGTNEENATSILENGLDPKLRSCQAYGPGEYFAIEPGLSTGYCKGGHKILVFAVIIPNTSSNPPKDKYKVPHDMVVVENNKHQLPIGVLSFRQVSEEARSRSTAARMKIAHLVRDMQQVSQQSQSAKAKAKIIQLLIRQNIDVAGEVYQRNQSALCDMSKREISMYAHRIYDADFVTFYFPSLPPPMSIKERDMADIKTVEALDIEESTLKRDLADAVHNNNDAAAAAAAGESQQPQPQSSQPQFLQIWRQQERRMRRLKRMRF